MTKRDRIRAIAIVAGAMLWLGESALARGGSTEPIVVAENVVREDAPAGAETPHDVAAKAPDAKRPSPPLPIFVPRTGRGAPASRIGGAARGVGTRLVVRALVPERDEAALTLSERPALPWHLSRATEHSVNFTLVDPDEVEPILDVTIPGPLRAGFHRIDLSEYDVRLGASQRYQWFVAVMPDPEGRSADIVARGSVERVAQAAPLTAQIAAARPEERAGVLAGAGIWYDALEAVHRLMPGDAAEAQRDSLLAQIGIELESGE